MPKKGDRRPVKKKGTISPRPLLTTKEIKFCYEYVINGRNGVKAAKKAGYIGDDRTLGVTSHRLLKKAKILNLISELTEEYLKDHKARAKDVIARLAVLGFRRMSDFIEVNEETRKTRLRSQKEIGVKDACVNKIKIKETKLAGDDDTNLIETETEIWLADQIKPLVTLGQHLGVINEKKEIDVNFPGGEFSGTKEVDVSNMSDDKLRELKKLLEEVEKPKTA